MRKLTIPDALAVEFATVEALWATTAQTRRVDSLLLSWVKYEKQLRRLFSFFVFQHPKFSSDKIDDIIGAFASSNNLYPETFISGITKLGVKPIKRLMGPEHERLWPEISRIKKYRNKIMHGQHSGLSIKSTQLERDVCYLVEWIDALAIAAEAEYGYDGLERNTYRQAKATANIAVKNYPFSNAKELKSWLAKLKR